MRASTWPTCRRSRSSSACRCARRKRSSCATPTTTRARTRCSTQALKEHPDRPDLLYDTRDGRREARPRSTTPRRACAASCELKPDDAQALNALGYTLVDRTPRMSRKASRSSSARTSSRRTIRSSSTAWAGRLFKLGRYAEAETLPAPRDEGASGRRRSPRTWAKCCGRRASATARRKSGSRSSRSRPTTRCCSKPCAASRVDAGSPHGALALAACARGARCRPACAMPPPAVAPATADASSPRSRRRDGCPRGAATTAVAVHFTWRHEPARDAVRRRDAARPGVARMRGDAVGRARRAARRSAPSNIATWSTLTQAVLGVRHSGRRPRVVDPGRARRRRRGRHRARCGRPAARAARSRAGRSCTRMRTTRRDGRRDSSCAIPAASRSRCASSSTAG